MTEQTDTTTKVKIQIDGQCEVEAMHLIDTEAKDEDALCQAEASIHQKMAAHYRTNAESHRRQAAEDERDAARYQNSAGRRQLEADRLEDEAYDYRQVVYQLMRETSLEDQQG